MAGKYLRWLAILDSLQSERMTNARRRRDGLTRHPIRAASCGCPAESCGAFHWVDRTSTIPTPAECRALLARDNAARKPGRGRPIRSNGTREDGR